MGVYMRGVGPTMKVGLRGRGRVAEDVVEDGIDALQPGAQACGGRLEHMFVTL